MVCGIRPATTTRRARACNGFTTTARCAAIARATTRKATPKPRGGQVRYDTHARAYTTAKASLRMFVCGQRVRQRVRHAPPRPPLPALMVIQNKPTSMFKHAHHTRTSALHPLSCLILLSSLPHRGGGRAGRAQSWTCGVSRRRVAGIRAVAARRVDPPRAARPVRRRAQVRERRGGAACDTPS